MTAFGVLLAFAAGPYYYLYGRDLVRAGYTWADLPRIYALGLMLLPVNLAGVVLSIKQAMTGRKTLFGRTPKVGSRTSVPPFYFIFNTLMLSIMIVSCGHAIATEHYGRIVFPIFNGAFYIYGLIAHVEVRESWDDVMLAIRKWLNRKRPQLLQQDCIREPSPNTLVCQRPSSITQFASD